MDSTKRWQSKTTNDPDEQRAEVEVAQREFAKHTGVQSFITVATYRDRASPEGEYTDVRIGGTAKQRSAMFAHLLKSLGRLAEEDDEESDQRLDLDDEFAEWLRQAATGPEEGAN